MLGGWLCLRFWSFWRNKSLDLLRWPASIVSHGFDLIGGYVGLHRVGCIVRLHCVIASCGLPCGIASCGLRILWIASWDRIVQIASWDRIMRIICLLQMHPFQPFSYRIALTGLINYWCMRLFINWLMHHIASSSWRRIWWRTS